MGFLKTLCVAAVTSAALVASAGAQQQPQAPPQPPATPRAAAPLDLTGVWVSVMTEDWRWRMVTPAPGDTLGIPLNPQGQKIAAAWDYSRDMGAGNACKAYGAGGIMRLPTRLRITWQDDSTLKIEADAGQQTKLLHFDASHAPAGPRTLQGHAVAQWVEVARGRGAGGRAAPAYGAGALKVVTTHLLDGYLRKNGVPYSADAVVTEYFDRVPGPDTSQWLIVSTTVEDPTYLTQPLLTSSHFMREPDESKWKPAPCTIDPPLVPGRPGVR